MLILALVAFAASSAFAEVSPVPAAGLNVVGEASLRPEQEFADEIERDFSLRSKGQLLITNLRGDIQVIGWAQDKIRVKAKRRVLAADEKGAKLLFGALDFRYRTLEQGDIELSAEYGRGLELGERLRERENPKTSMEIQVFAPNDLKLKVWSAAGKVSVRSRSASVDARTGSGPILIEQIRGESVSVLCPSCPILVKLARASLRCIAGSGDVELTDIDGSHVYVESSSGALRASRIRGQQLYVSKSGGIVGRDLRGTVEFNSQQGAVDMQNVSGFISGRTENGTIALKVKEWRFADKALIESVRGEIQMTLPAAFSGDIDVWSQTGKVTIGFPVEKPAAQNRFGPEPINHIVGRVGDGGEILKIYSEKGDIRLLR